MIKKASALKKDENPNGNSILDLIAKSSLNDNEKTVIENWSRHWKTSKYGKRTGKPVILNDVKNLFPLSPNSSFNCSDQNTEKRQSPTDVSYIMNQTSISRDTLEESNERILTNTKLIKRRLSFSENKNSLTKHREQLENLNDKQKNSTVVTMLNDISNPTLPITQFDGYENEQSACDNQFVCVPSGKQLDNSAKLPDKSYSKNAGSTTAKNSKKKKKPAFIDSNLSQSNSIRSTEIPNKMVNVVPQTSRTLSHDLNKKRLSTARKKIVDSLIFHNSQKKPTPKKATNIVKDSEDVHVKGLRSWLSTTFSSEPYNVSIKAKSTMDKSVNTEKNTEASDLQERSPKKDSKHLCVVLEDIASKTNQTLSKTPGPEKSFTANTLHQPLFEVDASTIAGVSNDGGLNRTKPGPPMSTPQQLSTLKEFDTVEKVSDESPAVLAEPVNEESDDSIGLVSEKPSSVSADEDTYAESQPVYVYENISDNNDNDVSLSQSKNINKTKKQKSASKRKESPQIAEDVKPLETKKKKANTSTSQFNAVPENKSQNLTGQTKKKTTVTGQAKNEETEQQKSIKKRKGTKANNATKNTKSKKQSYFQRQYDHIPPPTLVVPNPSPEAVRKGLRRSKRPRVRPLQTWFGEKMVYGDNEELLGLQTTNSFQPVTVPEQTKKSKSKKNRFSNCFAEPEQQSFLSPSNIEVNSKLAKNQKTINKTKKPTTAKKKKIPVDNNTTLQKSGFDNSTCGNHNPSNSSTTIQIVQNDQGTVVEASSLIAIPENEVFMGRNGKKYEAGDPLRFSKGISTTQLAMGTIVIFPEEEKNLSKMKTDTLCFYVAEGLVEVTLESAVTTIPSKSYFCIPPLNSYNIKNLSKKDSAFLFFTQIKNRT